jgi:hypothetical protein
VHLRQHQGQWHAINLNTFPEEHPWWVAEKKCRKNITSFKPPSVQVIRCFIQVIKGLDNQPMETIHPIAQHPCTTSDSLRFAIFEDRQVAKAEAEG